MIFSVARRFRLESLFVCLVSLFCGGRASAELTIEQVLDSPIPRFREVVPGIYRGGHPGAEGIAYLQTIGVKTNVDLENESRRDIAAEGREARARGITFISKPMSAFWKPNDAQVTEILNIISDPANQPVFVHCVHGEDRTGLIVGLFRVLHQNWEADKAYREMLSLGFHRELLGLKRYFRQKTGYYGLEAISLPAPILISPAIPAE